MGPEAASIDVCSFYDMTETQEASWRDLPSAVLCHILTIIPYKRSDVKAVCSSWRQAINSSINEVSIPAADLQLLKGFPNIKDLTVHGARPHQHWSQSQSCSTDLARGQSPIHQACIAPGPANHWPPSSSAGGAVVRPQLHQVRTLQQVNSWERTDSNLLNRLQQLRLLHCSEAVQQLAIVLSGITCTEQEPFCPALAGLKALELSGVACLGKLLKAVLQLRQKQQQWLEGHGSSTAAADPAAAHEQQASGSSTELHLALHQLQQLSISSSSVPAAVGQQLGRLLPQLPALRVLELTGCGHMSEVPDAVRQCLGLTKLVLSHNELITRLPTGLQQLTRLQELSLSGCAMLHTLGPGLSTLTSLTSLNLSGPSGLWLDYSAQQQAVTAAATAGSSLTAAANSSSSSGSAAAARAALPQLLLPPLPHQQQQLLLSELSSLVNLHTLDLSHNRQLMVLPGCVSRLHGLRVLNVRGCGVRWLGEDVLECQGLEELLLGDNVLAELPEDISRLTSLKALDVGGCCSLWSIPRSLLMMTALEELVVPSKGIGQHVIEQLELRCHNPVDIVMEPAESDDDAEADAEQTDDYVSTSSEDAGFFYY